jgi:hypothetical protein
MTAVLEGCVQSGLFEVYCQPITIFRTTDLWWRAVVSEITCETIKLISTRHYEVSTFICIEMVDRCVGVRVARAQPRADGGWNIEGTFLNPMSHDQLQALHG